MSHLSIYAHNHPDVVTLSSNQTDAIGLIWGWSLILSPFGYLLILRDGWLSIPAQILRSFFPNRMNNKGEETSPSGITIYFLLLSIHRDTDFLLPSYSNPAFL